MKGQRIRVWGASQHNLKNLDLEIPLYRLVGIAGVSGSGKSSLAFATLYAEGQRRYVETFSTYARQFLERLDRPQVISIESIPPAIAIDRKDPVRTSRSTVGTMTELSDLLKLLYARRSTLRCDGCGQPVEPDYPEKVWQRLLGDDKWRGRRVVITFPAGGNEVVALRAAGFDRLWDGQRVVDLLDAGSQPSYRVVADRVLLEPKQRSRFLDSAETAFQHGNGMMGVWTTTGEHEPFSTRLHCPRCNRTFQKPVANLFSFNSPVGACPRCRGFGRVMDIDMDLVVPDPELSLDQGAIKPWGGSQERRREYRQLRLLCREEGIPLDVPWARLSNAQKRKIIDGTSSRYGIREFFAWVESKSYKMHVRVYLSRFRTYNTCPDCGGTRFKPEALRYYLGGENIAQVLAYTVGQAREFFGELPFPDDDEAARVILEQINTRLQALVEVGLEYLTLDRQSRTLSGGEVQRVALAAALGTGLAETLYVLDEPSIGLHPRDSQRLLGLLRRLCDLRNTVVMVEHDPALLSACDRIIELGPGAGEQGGRVCAEGTPGRLSGLTADYLAGRRLVQRPDLRPPDEQADLRPSGWLRFRGVRANNLANIDVAIPLGKLVCITGVSGSGKSTLLEEVIYKGLRWHQGDPAGRPGEFTGLEGDGGKLPVELVDQRPVGRTPRANLATYSGALTAIRSLLAGTEAARKRRLQPRHFSFNVKGGRCPDCHGDGHEKIEMQFLADVYVPCPTCGGRRFQPRILEVTWQGHNIYDILQLTVQQARLLFADRGKVITALQPLLEIGLGYLPLGRSLNTLSGGEAQRLKLSRHFAGQARQPGILLLDEPTTGLHLQDVQQLVDILHRLVASGYTVVVVEHNLDLVKTADWIIDLGPEGGVAGGRVVAAGPPQKIARSRRSHTGRFLRMVLQGKQRQAAVADSLPQAAEAEPEYGQGITIRGARQHNLKNVDLQLPRGRLVAVSGLSGSGKSSLVFDVLFAEGQRRYLECLAPYVRQYTKVLERPEVDAIAGLPPTVAIEQRVAHAGQRSTVATMSEIYHYLRLMYARLALAHCPQCGRRLISSSVEEITQRLNTLALAGQARLLVTEVAARKGHHRTRLERLRRQGIAEARIDGTVRQLDPLPQLDRYRPHTIEAVLATIDTSDSSCEEQVRQALERGRGSFLLLAEDGSEIVFSSRGICPSCKIGLPPPDPLLFAFNTPRGACPQCQGSGRDEQNREVTCSACGGGRLRPQALSYRLAGRSIVEVVRQTPGELVQWLLGLEVEQRLRPVSGPLVAEVMRRCQMLEGVGLGYLALDRSGDTLSGGEAQRVRLAAQLGSNLAGACYVLDEPTIGLHPRDNAMLLKSLYRLRDRGNSVIVVEHDRQTLQAADVIVELGPGGGENGGAILAVASPAELATYDTPTGRLLARPGLRPRTNLRPPPGSWIEIVGASWRNLRQLDVRLPLGRLVCVTGVSGSGKSSLVMETLGECLSARLAGKRLPPGRLHRLSGRRLPGRVRVVDHEPIGRTPRSTPATYIGLWSRLRTLLAASPEARARGYGPGRFSFNRAGGQCPACRGFGIRKVEMNFLPDVYLPCHACGGLRFNSETLAVTYRGLSAGQILELSFEQARQMFSALPSLQRACQVVCDIGLGYLKLGQPSPTLSGGEAQRIKLAAELAGSNSTATLFLLDEPTTGLHRQDVEKLLGVLNGLVEAGHSVVVIEHNLDFIDQADWVIDLGPEGGSGGGRLLFSGPPAELRRHPDLSHTARALAGYPGEAA